jgi:hypothetical protein
MDNTNNEVIIRRKQNGLYEVRNVDAEAGTIGERTIEVIADDIDGLDNAVEIANNYLDECEEEGYPVEYGLNIINY